MIHPKLLALEQSFAACPTIAIIDPVIQKQGVELWIKRDDLLHPIISGNKWRKLKYIINHALSLGTTHMVSMGGAYSNHLHALAAAGQALNIKTSAFIRGERPTLLNPTLQDLMRWDMTLEFVSRSDYRLLRQYRNFDSLPNLPEHSYWLPEGGALSLALQGVGESIKEINFAYDVLVCACGTGTTLAGLVAHAPDTTKILGISALKGDFLTQDVEKHLTDNGITKKNWQINSNYHFGGFGKRKPALDLFIQQFVHKHAIPIEAVYTGKVVYAVYDLIQQGYFNQGERIVILHTGGLQGMRTAQ